MSFHVRRLRHWADRSALVAILAACAPALWLPGCKGEGEQADVPRSVTVVELRRTDPAVEFALTGSAEAWQQEDVAFEVAGTLIFVVDREQPVLGPAPAPAGEEKTPETRPATQPAATQPVGERKGPVGRTRPVLSIGRAREGTRIAALDSARYELVVAELRAQLGAAKAAEDSVISQIESVLPARIRASQAQLELSLTEARRIEKALSVGAATQMELDEEKARIKVARANVEKLEAEIDSIEGERRNAAAKVASVTESLKRAELDLKRCSLLAPFSGQVTDLYTMAGAYVQPGQKVARVTMMDPIHVNVAVSAETDREVNIGDLVRVTPPGSDESIEGFVYTQDSVADPKLRTFRIRIMVRNRLIYIDLPSREQFLEMLAVEHFRKFLAHVPAARRLYEDPRIGPLLEKIRPPKEAPEEVLAELAKDYRVRTRLIGLLCVKGVIPIVTASPDTRRPLLADVKCIQTDEEGHFVWKVVGSNATRTTDALQPIITLKKVRVRLGPEQFALVNLYLFRQIDEVVAEGQQPELEVATILAAGVPEWVRDGDRVLRLRERWLIRPGDMVAVRWADRGPPEGFYVPMAAIVLDPEGEHYVHVAVGEGDNLRAKRIAVTVGDEIGDRRRIESDELTEGDRLVLHGTSLLTSDEPVQIVQLQEETE